MVLDGQQRITSLYAVRKGARLTRDGVEIDYRDIVIDLSVDPEDEEEVVFDFEPDGHECISVFGLLNATVRELVKNHPEQIDRVSMYKERLERYDFSAVIIDDYPIDIAREVFTRINTGGVELKLFEIMVAKTFDQERDFDLAEQYRDLLSTEGEGKDLEAADTTQCLRIRFCNVLQLMSAAP